MSYRSFNWRKLFWEMQFLFWLFMFLVDPQFSPLLLVGFAPLYVVILSGELEDGSNND